MLLRYHDDNFLFETSSFEATFSEGAIVRGGNVTFHKDTPLGNELWITSSVLLGENTSSDRIVRLIFINPEQDWRSNQTYAWKLDSAWMSADKSSSDAVWLHWNVQSYTNSSIQVREVNDVWECNEVELRFRPIRKVASDYPVTGDERVVLKNVRLGLGLPAENIHSVSPCPGHPRSCSVVDGDVEMIDRPWEAFGSTRLDSLQQTRLLEAGAIVALLALIVLFVVLCWRRQHRANLYQQLSPTPDENLDLKVEDTYEDSEPRSTVEGVVNETR